MHLFPSIPSRLYLLSHQHPFMLPYASARELPRGSLSAAGVGRNPFLLAKKSAEKGWNKQGPKEAYY